MFENITVTVTVTVVIITVAVAADVMSYYQLCCHHNYYEHSVFLVPEADYVEN
jgi:hypothetical protein